MQVHSDIAALRNDPVLQRQANQAMRAALSDWHSDPVVAVLAKDLNAYAAGSPLAACDHLSALLHEHTQASRFVSDWCRLFTGQLVDAPLGQVPFRHSYSAGLSTMQLLRRHGASLSLLAYEQRDDAGEPTSVMFADQEICETVLAGRATGYKYQIGEMCDGQAVIGTTRSNWSVGDCTNILPGSQARQFVRVENAMLILQLGRVPANPGPSRTYASADGKLLHQAGGDKRSSQRFLAVGVLGALDRKDAIPAMRDLGLDIAQEDDLRWEAIRQTLALDSRHGFALLNECAAAQNDPLAQSARALRESLIAADRRFAAWEREVDTCPA